MSKLHENCLKYARKNELDAFTRSVYHALYN